MISSETKFPIKDCYTPVHIKKLEQGKQGVTGLASINDEIYVYKCSQFMNFLSFHEYTIMKSLEKLYPVCPHFCRPIALEQMNMHPNFIYEENPFITTGKTISLDVLWMEYIPDSISFSSVAIVFKIFFGLDKG